MPTEYRAMKEMSEGTERVQCGLPRRPIEIGFDVYSST